VYSEGGVEASSWPADDVAAQEEVHGAHGQHCLPVLVEDLDAGGDETRSGLERETRASWTVARRDRLSSGLTGWTQRSSLMPGEARPATLLT
jgi:hypothetical protein